MALPTHMNTTPLRTDIARQFVLDDAAINGRRMVLSDPVPSLLIAYTNTCLDPISPSIKL